MAKDQSLDQAPMADPLAPPVDPGAPLV